MQFSRNHKNFISSWWYAIDKYMLVTILMVIIFGIFIVATASLSVADRIGVDSYYFLKRQVIYLVIASTIIFIFSLLSEHNIKKIAIIGFIFFLILMMITLGIGSEIKGAKRWLRFADLSLQPSEFIKPFFVVISSWILAQKHHVNKMSLYKWTFIIYLLVIAILLLQPDFGMALIISFTWAILLFLSGISILFVIVLSVFGIVFIVGAYFMFPHVAQRINSFIDPSSSENYQIKKSLAAFRSGGLFGLGPGEGRVKQYLPDAHTDFIFPVIAEELGAITCIALVIVYLFIFLRCLRKISESSDLFTSYCIAGLIIMFTLQALINISVTLNILPTKGMTLPLISYGGSSLISVSIMLGIILALTKKKFGYKSKNTYKYLNL